ncbi:hypothetical protein [Lysinibacillus fusiformis]|uniref:hypothetical protein n=1 Tax=Lysinibacillus TaxID=400634 RepID=UPI0018E6115B|nr:hypothetical protein [Lysinibacillus fusiformis]MBI6863788.1 hypothetical protein [Lysinibacillus fusiformis]
MVYSQVSTFFSNATFAIQYDQLFGVSSCEPFPFYLDGSQLNQLNGTMQPFAKTGFYAELHW